MTTQAQINASKKWNKNHPEINRLTSANYYHNHEIYCQVCDRVYKKANFRKHVLTNKHIRNEWAAMDAVEDAFQEMMNSHGPDFQQISQSNN